MAKDNLGLLQEIVSQLRMLNKSSVRDRLREAEEAKRAEKLAGSSEIQTQQQDTIIDGATDFQRRFLAGQAKTFTDKKLQDQGSKLAVQKEILEQNKRTADALIAMNEGTDKFRANAARTAAETRREGKGVGRGNAEGSKATQFKKGWNKQTPAGTENWLQTAKKLIPLLAIWAVGSLVMGIKDFVYGYDESGLSGGIAGLLGGADTGGFANAVRNAFKGAGYGMLVGGVFGGLPGAIIGGLIGMGVGALLGWIGAEKIENWIDEEIKSPWKEMSNYFRAKHRELSRWIFTPAVGGPHGHGAKMFGSELIYKIRFFNREVDWSRVWDNISDWFKEKYEWLRAKVYTAPEEGKPGTLFGSELAWTISFWQPVDGWGSVFTKIGDQFGEWGSAAMGWLYTKDGETVKMFGGEVTMPSWSKMSAGLKKEWDDFWIMIFSIPDRLGEMIKDLFPERVQEWLGWNNNVDPAIAAAEMMGWGPDNSRKETYFRRLAEYGVKETGHSRIGVRDWDVDKNINDYMSGVREFSRLTSGLLTDAGSGGRMARGDRVPAVVDASNNTEIKIFHSQEKVVFGVYPPSMLPTNPALWHPNGSLAQ